jgi:hypothetical protein
MVVLAGFHGAAAAPRSSFVVRLARGAALKLAALASRGWDTAAQIAVFLWMALVVGLFCIVAAGFLLA